LTNTYLGKTSQEICEKENEQVEIIDINCQLSSLALFLLPKICLASKAQIVVIYALKSQKLFIIVFNFKAYKTAYFAAILPTYVIFYMLQVRICKTFLKI